METRPFHLLTPEEAREAYREGRQVLASQPMAAHVENLRIAGPHGEIPIRIYRPLTATVEKLPVLVYYHGGGWTIGDLDTHDPLCRELATLAGCAIVSVDYRLAPEHPFPIAFDEAVAALDWVVRERIFRSIAIGGDSAGGNLAAAVALHARDHGGPELALQVLIYPATDQHASMPSHFEPANGCLLNRELILYFRSNYLSPEAYSDWRASPLLAASHADLPPALLIIAGLDPLRDEGLAYADRLREAGVPVEVHTFSKDVHGFVNMGGVCENAHRALEISAERIAAAFRSRKGMA